jgi:phosphoglycolate phosphatase
MTRIRGVLFDKDGTLFDFQATWGAWSRGMIEAESGGDPALRERIAAVLGYDLATNRFRPDSIVIASTTETVAEHLMAVLPGVDKDALMARMNDRAADAPQVEVVGLREVLDRLAGMGLSLGVATNDTEGPARSHLRAAGIEGLFGFIAGFDSGWGGKPAAGQLLAFADAAGLAPGACVMVGDSLHDLAAARTAGMAGVGVLTGVAGRETLEPAADVVLDSIAELPDWVAALV